MSHIGNYLETQFSLEGKAALLTGGAGGIGKTRLALEVASGRKTWAERGALHNALVLFNPAPVT